MRLSVECNEKEKNRILEQLYFKYSKLMYYVAYGILQDHFLAEDAVQSAFLKLKRNRFAIDEISCQKTKSFMVIIIRNISMSMIGHKNKENIGFEEDSLEDLTDKSSLTLDLIVSNESIEYIINALNSMDSKYSDALRMKSLYGFSIPEIAKLFDSSEQVVRVRLFRARKMLMERLNEEASHE